MTHFLRKGSLPPHPCSATDNHYLLQHQAQALIERFGMDPGLSPVLRELWLAFVAHTRLLEPATIT